MRSLSTTATLLLMLSVPATAGAQPIARTFEEVRGLVANGDYVVVVESGGTETWGKVADISASTLVVTLAVRSPDGARVVISGERRVVASDSMALLHRSDATGHKGDAIYPASWAQVDALPAGTDVSVELRSGERRRFDFVRADLDSLSVRSADGRHEALPKSRIGRVVRHGVADGTGDGAVIGALAGAGTGLGLMSMMYATCDGCDAPARGPMFLAAATFSAAIGAAAGWIVDRLHKGRRIVFPVALAIRR